MNQCLDFSTFFFSHVFTDTDNKKQTKNKRQGGEDVASMAGVWILCNVCDLGIKA